MDRAVEDNGRLGTLASASPDVNTSQRTTLERVSKGEELGLGREASLKVSEKLKVISVAVVGGEPRITWHCQIVSTRISKLDEGEFGLTRIHRRGLFLSKGSANILNQDGGVGCKLLHLADVLGRNDKVDFLRGTRVENGGSELVNLGNSILSSLGEGDTQALEAIVVNLLGAGNSRGQGQREKSENERPHLGNELSIASWRINCAQDMRRSD
jgi:hypothetical protein